MSTDEQRLVVSSLLENLTDEDVQKIANALLVVAVHRFIEKRDGGEHVSVEDILASFIG